MFNWLMKLFGIKEQRASYLGRDLSQHRVHATKYEDLCK